MYAARLRSGARKHYHMRPVLRGIFWNAHNVYHVRAAVHGSVIPYIQTIHTQMYGLWGARSSSPQLFVPRAHNISDVRKVEECVTRTEQNCLAVLKIESTWNMEYRINWKCITINVPMYTQNALLDTWTSNHSVWFCMLMIGCSIFSIVQQFALYTFVYGSYMLFL